MAMISNIRINGTDLLNVQEVITYLLAKPDTMYLQGST